MAFTLAHASELGQIVRVTCQHCRITRRYMAKDLLLLCGPIGIHEIPGNFRCEKCDRKEFMVADWESLYGCVPGKIKVRKLIRIELVRKPIWEDGVL
jgi:hypothetical protein